MQFATKATLLAALTVISGSMLIDTVAAVEVTDSATPVLPMGDVAAPIEHQLPPSSDHPSPDCFILGARSFTIPFTVDADGTQPREVHLFVSRGTSGSWKLFAQKRPDVSVKQFQFTAEEDGEYWFATRTIDAQGLSHPAGAIESQLKVFVDTTKPQVRLEAEADANGQVNAVLVVNDATPLTSVQLRYVTDVVSEWKNVDIRQLPRDGKLQFTPNDSWKRISLQFVGTDTPGNRSVVTQLLRRPRLAESQESRHAAAPAYQPGLTNWTTIQLNTSELVSARATSVPVIKIDRSEPIRPPSNVSAKGYATDLGRVEAAYDSFRAAQYPAPTTTGAPHLVAAPRPQSSSIDRPTHSIRATPVGQRLPFFGSSTALPAAATPEQISNGFGLNSPQQAVPETRPVASSPETRPRRGRTPAEAMRPLSENSSTLRPVPEGISAARPEFDPNPKRYESMRSTPTETASAMGRAAYRYSDSERFSLEYELEAVGSQGVDAVELYGTTDGSRSWTLWGQDPDRRSPFDIETKDQGIFGFRIVVVGRNGLASPRPQSGDTPDIVVVVDKQAPQVRITGAQYGTRERIGALVIRYECDDLNLPLRPIALSFSDSVRGPWTTIAAGLQNDGDYVWPADPKLPRQLFLRIDATDQAGNVGTDILDQPIDAQGLAPRARIRGFQPLSGAQPPAVGEQTAMRPYAVFQ